MLQVPPLPPTFLPFTVATVNGKKVGGNGGTCNNSDFNDANNHVCFYSYEGYWDSAQSAFVITHGMKWSNNGDPRIELVAADGTTPAPKTITQSEYATVMVLNGHLTPLRLHTRSA